MRRSGSVLTAILFGLLPIAAGASEIVTFDWVPVQNGGAGQAKGTLTLLLPSFTAATDPFSPNGQWYSSPTYGSNSSAEAALTGLNFTFSNGMNVDWGSNASLSFTSISAVSTPSGPSLAWATDDGLLIPQVQAGQTAAPAGNYLITGFQLSGQTTGGMAIYFDVVNSSGSVYSPGPQESFNGITGGISDEGFWMLESVAPVPLPSSLLLLMGGAALLISVRTRKPASSPHLRIS